MIKRSFYKVISFLMVLNIFLICLCSCNPISFDADGFNLDKLKSEYENTKTEKSLARLIVVSMNELNLNCINAYGEDFLFSSQKNTLYNEFSSMWFEMNNEFTDDSILNLYESLVWMYMFSFLYDSELQEPIYYSDNKSEIDETYARCLVLLKETGGKAAQGVLVAEKVLNDGFLERFLGTVNLSIENTSEDIKDYAYQLLWEIAFEINNQELGQFFTIIYSSDFYNKSTVTLRNPRQNGFLKDVSLDELKKQLDKITESDNPGYNDIASLFDCLPKELLNGKYYSCNYYSSEYVVSFFGTTVNSMSISDTKTGVILYMRYKSPSLSGLKWHEPITTNQ